MASASVVQLNRKSSPGAAPRSRGQEKGPGTSAVVLQFPRRQTVEEIVREYLTLKARYMPHVHPGGLPRDLEGDVAKWLQIASVSDGPARAIFVKNWLADITEYKEELANGKASVGRYGDPASEAYWHSNCVYFYGEPEEGHPAWTPWLAQQQSGMTPCQSG